MTGSNKFLFSEIKNHFYKYYPHIKKVEVEVKPDGRKDFVARLKVKAGNRWIVVKKSGEGIREALKKAKESMSLSIRKEWRKGKRRYKFQLIPVEGLTL